MKGLNSKERRFFTAFILNVDEILHCVQNDGRMKFGLAKGAESSRGCHSEWSLRNEESALQ